MKKGFPRKVVAVYCSGGTRANKKFEYEGVVDCKAALEGNADGNMDCSYGCLGLGSCIKACRLGAIHMNEYGVAEVDPEKCVNCGLCKKACPRQIIHTRLYDAPFIAACSNHDKGADARKMCSVSCIGCKMCENNCPCDAITVQDNCAVMSDDVCLVCGKCVTKCPRKLIYDARGIILP